LRGFVADPGVGIGIVFNDMTISPQAPRFARAALVWYAEPWKQFGNRSGSAPMLPRGHWRAGPCRTGTCKCRKAPRASRAPLA